MTERAAATRRWALANAEAHSLPELIDPFVGTFIQRAEPDSAGGLLVDFGSSSESRLGFIFQLAYLSGWVATDASFEQRWVRFQDPSRFGEYSGWNALPDPGDDLRDPAETLDELEARFDAS